MSDNKCVACGQWSGKGHHCPPSSAVAVGTRRDESPLPRYLSVPGDDITERVTRARETLTPDPRFRVLDWAASDGLSFQGYVTTTYASIESIIGPTLGPGDKSTAEWVIEIHTPSGPRIASVYDYISSGVSDAPYHWHVGGRTPDVVNAVASLLNAPARQPR